MVLDGLTAYGFDSVPTHTARIEAGATRARESAPRAASIAMVTVSSSADGTDFSSTGRRASVGRPQAAAITRAAMRGRGMQAPYPAMPTSRAVFTPAPWAGPGCL